MSVYLKFENNELIPAKNGYNGITGLADSPELCEANGFTAYTEEEVSGYFSGTHIIVNGILTNISDTDDYKEKIKKEKKSKIIQEYAQKFSEFDTMWSRNVALGKKNTTQMSDARNSLQTEYINKLSEV